MGERIGECRGVEYWLSSICYIERVSTLWSMALLRPVLRVPRPGIRLGVDQKLEGGRVFPLDRQKSVGKPTLVDE